MKAIDSVANGQRPKKDILLNLMSPEYMEGRRSDRLPTIESIWLEGRSPLPSINLIAALEASFDIVFGLFGIGRNATPSEIIINKLATNRLQSRTAYYRAIQHFFPGVNVPDICGMVPVKHRQDTLAAGHVET